jgi:hypothetical protein
MSNLTSCNYCKLKRIKAKAKKENKSIIKRPSNFMRGTEVFLVPEGFVLPPYKEPNSKLPNGCEVYQKYCVAWMMKIPDQCCC